MSERTPEQELDILRLGLRRVAEVANRLHNAGLEIPTHSMIEGVTAERGWNRLCSDLIGWMSEFQLLGWERKS